MTDSRNLWDEKSIAMALQLAPLSFSCKANRISINSKEIKEGDLFIGIRGKQFNGNLFAKEALDKGAVAAIVDDENLKNCASKIILVPDSLKALEQLAQYSRDRTKAKIIGVTGSVGKTSTKEMLKHALYMQGDVYTSFGNFNNHIGLPLALANMPYDTDYGVFELAMSAAGEISHLSKLLKPDVALITTVEPAHLESYISVSEIAKAKAEIFDGMKINGFAVINMDNIYHSILIEKATQKKLNIVTFGSTKGNDFYLEDFITDGFESTIKIEACSRSFQYNLKVAGKHHALNSIGVLAVCKCVDAEIEFAAQKGLLHFTLPKGRGKIYQMQENIMVIDDAYNASPASVKAAIENLEHYKKLGYNLTIVLGDMKELGMQSVYFHKALLTTILEAKIDIVHCVGDLMKHLYDLLPNEIKGFYTKDSMEMACKLKALTNNDAILVKGSNSMKMDLIVEALTHGYKSRKAI